MSGKNKEILNPIIGVLLHTGAHNEEREGEEGARSAYEHN